jgi:hypothetical protein
MKKEKQEKPVEQQEEAPVVVPSLPAEPQAPAKDALEVGRLLLSDRQSLDLGFCRALFYLYAENGVLNLQKLLRGWPIAEGNRVKSLFQNTKRYTVSRSQPYTITENRRLM